MGMTKHRHDQILAGQISTVRKVYEVVPIAHAWTIAQITGELARLGIKQEPRHIEGCLRALVDAGLVNVFSRNRTYQRLYCFPEVEPEAQPKKLTPKETAPMPAPKKIDPLDKLSRHAVYLRELANEIDEAVMEAMQQLEAAKAEGSDKLGKLRDALAAIGLGSP